MDSSWLFVVDTVQRQAGIPLSIKIIIVPNIHPTTNLDMLVNLRACLYSVIVILQWSKIMI